MSFDEEKEVQNPVEPADERTEEGAEEEEEIDEEEVV